MRTPPRPEIALRSIRLGLVVLNLLIVVLCGLMIERSWRREIGDAETQAVTAVRLLERGATATFDKVSIALNGVAGLLERQIAERGVDATSLWQLVDAATVQVPELERIGVFDTAGQQVCGIPLDRCRKFGIGDRDYFALLRDHPDTPPALYGPYNSRPANEPSLVMARALRTPGQPFAGVVVAIVPLVRLQPLVAAARFGPNGAASLRTVDMQPLAHASRLASQPETIAADAVSEPLRRQLGQSPEAGVALASAVSDGLERITAYRKLAGHPVYALVGEATEDFLGPWRGRVAWTCGFMLLIVAASLAIERTVRKSLSAHDRARRLYDEAPCGYHTLDAEGRYLSINATELQWLGCTRDEVIGKLGPADFLTDEGRAAFAANFPRLKSTGRLDEVPVDLVGRDGQARRVLVSATIAVDAQGRFVSTNSVMHDISALHRAQQQLHATAKLQALMLDTELVGMARLKDRRVVWANRGMDRIFGYSGDEWRDMPTRRLHVDEASYERLGLLGYRQLLAGEPYRAHLQLRRKDGSLCWMAIGAAPLRREQDEVMLLVTDISAQKAAEAARLREVQLRAHNEQLLETGRIKDDFLSNMSHELRTPLNAVIGFAQLLGVSPLAADSPRHANYIRQIFDSGQHLLTLVQTMLDFANTAHGRMAFTSETLVVREVLDAVAEMLAAKALAAQVELTVSVEPGLDTVANDPLRLRQMLLNLASNAVKFSKPAGVVNLRARGLGPARWCIEVEDQGIGIGEADLEQLFAPFVQISSGPAKAYSGAGLGLALVRRIADAQGGEVQVRSQPGLGSVFTLVLPRILAAWPASAGVSGAVS